MNTNQITHEPKVRWLPIDRITVLNGRSRGKHKFKQIVANIAALGLKKPITVARRAGDDDGDRYVLACGQGRMDVFIALGQTEIPAIIVEATDEQVMLMSLAENLARRPRTTVELAREIVAMKERGYKVTEIAKKVDLHQTYVNGMINLLQRGETYLLNALKKRRIPMTVAILIAESKEEDLQRAMVDAYDKGELKGKALIIARRLVDKRLAKGKSGRGGPRSDEPVNANTLLKAYKKEASKQQMLVDEARLCDTRLRFVVSAVKKLRADEGFVNLARAEGLLTLPHYLTEQTQSSIKENSDA
jgi:ParB family chromosome partitioning protein